MSPVAMSSKIAKPRSRSTMRRCMYASEWRRRSRRGGKDTPPPTTWSVLDSLMPFKPDQETIGEHNQDGMPMKTTPTASLILIPAQHILGFFVILLNPVTAVGVFHQAFQARPTR